MTSKKYANQGNYSIYLFILLMTEFINSFLRAKNFVPLGVSVGFRRIIFIFFLINFIWITTKNIASSMKISVKSINSYLGIFCFACYVILIYLLKNSSYDLTEILNLVSWWIVPVLFYHYGMPDNKKLFSTIIFLFVAVYFVLYLMFVINSEVFIWNNPELVNSIYYMIAIIPLLLFVENRFFRISILIMVVAATVLSLKSTAIIIVIVSLFCYLINMGNTLNKYLKRIGIIFCLLILSIPLLSIVEQLFDVNIIGTLMENLNDGGNGRADIWENVINHFNQGKISEKIFGFGFDTSSRLFGLATHNDFIGVMFDFGVVGLMIMAESFIALWITARRCFKGEKIYIAISLMMVQTIFLFLFSNVLFTSKYNLILFATYSLIMSSANKEYNGRITV